MKKLLVLGSMLSALILTGAGCSIGNAPVTPKQQTSAPAEETPPSATLPASQPTASQSVTPNPTTPPPVTPKPATAQVTIANFAFAPASITVKAGTIVKWTNDDQVPHRIKSDNGSFADSADLNTSDSYQFKFNTPGTYNYSCGIHPSMRGQIIVQ